uniref:Cysteine-rich protein 1 n=1 Tax=Conus geographus TaxID=6491 RepID=W4VSD0_CONGE
MKTLCGNAVCGLLTVMLISMGKANGQNCGWFRKFDVQGCLNNFAVDFNQIFEPSYTQHLCSQVQPLEGCIGAVRSECPDLAVFQGGKGLAIDTVLASLSRICVGNGGDVVTPASGGRCPGTESKFRRRLGNCHAPMQMNLQESQMCQPMDEIITCMEGRLQRFRPCSWMTTFLADRVQFWIDFERALWFVRYECAGR